MNKKPKVVVGLSGGVDSSVAAFLLLESGYDVIGIFMKNWHDDSVTISNDCPWEEDSKDALLVANHLKIPFQTIDLSVEYKSRIVDYMFSEYEKGRTPNPDILCNRDVKFDIFLKHALQLGADFVATGHYCQKNLINNHFQLLAGADLTKDQSYFLCQIDQFQLKHALFPIGHLQKSEVRQIAEKQGLLTFDKKDSQGLCFIGKVKLPDFLQQQLKPKQGNIIEISENFNQYLKYNNSINADDLDHIYKPFDYHETDGTKIGVHQGAHFYTIGQRKGLNVGGTKLPLFVIGINTTTNTVYVGEGENHPGLYRMALIVKHEEFHWVNTEYNFQNINQFKTKARIRYRQELQDVSIINSDDGIIFKFDKLQRGITSGQFIAIYIGNELVGSGVID